MKKRLSYFLMAVLIVFSMTGGALAEAVPGIATNQSILTGLVSPDQNPESTIPPLDSSDQNPESTIPPLDSSDQNPESTIPPMAGAGTATNQSILTGLVSPDQNSESSIQLMFVKLQLEQAEIMKKQTMDKMEQIQKSQEVQKQVAGYLNEARQAQEDAGDGTSDMSDEMKQYMDRTGLAYDKTGNDSSMTSDEWDTTINSLEALLAKLGTETQQQMVDVQNSIGQYNSYLGGANTQIGNTQQTLTSLTRGMSRYGESDVGLAVTALVVGLVLGCVITLAAQKIGGKKDKA